MSTPTATQAAQILADLTSDDDFYSGVPTGMTSAATAVARPVALAPVGERMRPNGQIYKPRQIGPHEDLALMRAAQLRRESVLLYGPPGTGKTAMIEAAYHDAPGLESVIGSADLTEADLVGTFVQDPVTRAFTWAPGPLHRSVLKDVPLLVDEIALIDPKVLSILYPLMDGRSVLQITMNPQLPPLKLGPRWMVVAACNPDVPGAQLSEALKSRFAHHLLVGTDWQLARELGVPDTVVTIAENLDRRRIKGEITWSPQLRELLSFRDLAPAYGPQYAAAALAASAPEHDRDELITALRKFFPNVTAARVEGRYGA
ncbi:AAA family ATPase (plasmid) [Streptosporangium sp. CA-135522]|uniref:AAA family ATPase n=1 Tax=Streptosporangium sp. CA-135522 TaxID=3240072 RepID=UPI003D8CD153